MNTIISNTKLNERDYWETPQKLVDQIAKILHVNFMLDPCSTNVNKKCPINLTEVDDGLNTDWINTIHNHTLSFDAHRIPAVYCNPPFSKMGNWTNKIIVEALNGLTVALIHPDTPDTKVYQKIEKHCFMQLRPRTRINFIKPGDKNESVGVSFPTVISIFNAMPRQNIQHIRFDINK